MRNERDQIMELQDELRDALQEVAALQYRIDEALLELRNRAMSNPRLYRAIDILEGAR